MTGVAPLMGAVISQDNQIERISDFEILRSTLIPAEQQYNRLSTSFSYIAYSHQYLNGSLPAFTKAPNQAVLPFQPSHKTPPHPGELWAAKSTLYEASLDCAPGVLEVLERNGSAVVQFSSEAANSSFILKDGTIGDLINYNSPYSSFMLHERLIRALEGDIDRLQEDALVGFIGRQSTSTSGKIKNRAGIQSWASRLAKSSVIFCTPVHEQQEVEVIVDAKLQQIQNITELGSPKAGFGGLNMTYWQDLLLGYTCSASTASFNVTTNDRLFNASSNRPCQWGLPDHLSQLRKRPAFRTLLEDFRDGTPTDIELDQRTVLTKPINVHMLYSRSLTPFGLSRVADLEELFSPDKLRDMFSYAYGYLFTMAMGVEVANQPPNSSDDATSGQRIYAATGYKMNELWARLLQAVLSLILCLDVVFIALLWERKCDISDEPGSIASIMACVKPNVLRDFEGAEFMKFKQLVASLNGRGHRYALQDQKVAVCNEGDTALASKSGSAIYNLVPGEESQAPGENNRDTVDLDVLDRSKITLSKPWGLAAQYGVLAVAIIIGGVVLLGILYKRSNTQNGFREPASQFLYDFYSSYLPTICALLFGGYLTLLATHVTLTYPFIQLGRGRATAAPLCHNYEKLPPHLQLVSGIKTRNFLLASLSVSILLANVLAVALGGLFYKDLVSREGSGNVALNWPVESLHEFNGTLGALFEGVSDIDAEFFYAATGVGLGFRQLPWTTDSFYYVPFSDRNPAINRTNYTTETWGVGVDITCEAIPKEEVRIWNSPVNDSSVPPTSTFSYPTFRDDINTTLIIEEVKDFEFRAENEPLQRYLEVGEFGNGSSVGNKSTSEFYELVPKLYPPALPGPWKFFGGWFRYDFATRTVKIDRASARNLVGDTIDGPTAYILNYTAIRCAPTPKIVRSVVLADPDGTILHSNDTAIPPDISGASNMTGLPGVLDSFQEMINRVTGKSRDVKANDISESMRKLDPRPSNWLSFLLHREAREKNAIFDLYSYPEQSAQAMETVYRRLFAIYVSLHAERILGAEKAQTRDAMFVRHTVNRVFMTPVAFFVSVVLLVVFVPVVVWTYVSLFTGFLCHSPETLAGMYTAVYASGAVEDVAGMEGVGEKERERRLREVGCRYGYGWFETEVGERHFGIDREPLLKSGG